MEKAVDRVPSREAVIGALDNCYDPCCRDRKISVVDMRLIESIDIEGRRVEIEMVLTTGWCPFASRLLEMVTEEIGALPAVDSVDVDVVWNPTWTPERMSESAREVEAAAGEAGATSRGAAERRGLMIKDDVPVFDCVAHFIVRSPRQFAEWIGKLIFWCWEDKIIYGSETPIWHPIRSTSTPRTCSEMRASCSANTSLLSIMS